MRQNAIRNNSRASKLSGLVTAIFMTVAIPSCVGGAHEYEVNGSTNKRDYHYMASAGSTLGMLVSLGLASLFHRRARFHEVEGERLGFYRSKDAISPP